MKLIKSTGGLKLNKFFMIPKELLVAMGSGQSKLKANDVIIYSLMLDRLNLSLTNHEDFSNSSGEVYVVFNQKEIADTLGLSNRGVISSISRLEEEGLLKVVRQGNKKPNLYFFYDIFSDDSKWLSRFSPAKCKTLTSMEVQNSHCNYTDTIYTDINNTQDTNKNENTDGNKDKKTKTYTTLSSGGFFLKHYADRFKDYFKIDHRAISQDDLIELSHTLNDIIDELSIDRVLYTSIVDYHFKNLSTQNNGHIKAFIGRKNDSPLYRYINELV